MEHITITTLDNIQTISWLNGGLVDWANAGSFYVAGSRQIQLSTDSYNYGFDGAITSSNGDYAFIYQKLGTKGLLLKNGNLLREINRSYYQADVYEYPAAFITIGKITYLIHCPIEYCRLDFENVETGEIVTDIPERKPDDFFHSRLEISPSGKYLMSKGWGWHPVNLVFVFDVADCLNNPLVLDAIELGPDTTTQICTASFLNDFEVLIGSSDEVIHEDRKHQLPPEHIAVWNIKTDQLSTPVKVDAEFGNLFAISEELAWDTFKYPKIININTGKVLEKKGSVNSGTQQSSIIIGEELVQIAFNPQTKQLAIVGGEGIELLTPSV